MKNLQSIMLVDDNKADNFFHELVIKKSGFDGKILAFQYAEEALSYLQQEPKNEPLDIIFLDINMPRMNGFEFLDAFSKLNLENEPKVIMMLTTSLNPTDKQGAERFSQLKGYINKPLTEEMFLEIVENYF